MISNTFSLEAAISGPLEFNFPITAQVSIKTSVFGEARNNAAVSILFGSLTIWTGTMTQVTPTVDAPPDLLLGDVTIKKAQFRLTIPTTQQSGNVTMDSLIKSGDNPSTPFFAQVASWPLSSALVAKS